MKRKRKRTVEERKASLLRLHREYTKESIRILDIMIPLAEDLTTMTSPDIVKAYQTRLDELEHMVKHNQSVIRHIKEQYEHLCSGQRPPTSRQ